MTEENRLVDKAWLQEKLRLLIPKNKQAKAGIILAAWLLVFLTNNIWAFLCLLAGLVSWVYLTEAEGEV